ncbi:unnamed protein product [Fraxinus pennsylvanica]|uniref:Vacuolar protein sorting-associated protein 51 homolog n=1 Tax=Fraxinus pennsylvanica TaxID=56036 RepID=A0AAD2E4G1_9LAMI|nr:unnamed protein product [Fraxinus pennsylvanica]
MATHFFFDFQISFEFCAAIEHQGLEKLQQHEHSSGVDCFESVITTIAKLSLKSLQELVRLQTFNRSGFQQIQLDIQFLKSTLRDIAEDEAAIDFLLDEVIDATTERCLDPVPLKPPILDRLVKAKLTKTSQ